MLQAETKGVELWHPCGDIGADHSLERGRVGTLGQFEAASEPEQALIDIALLAEGLAALQGKAGGDRSRLVESGPQFPGGTSFQEPVTDRDAHDGDHGDGRHCAHGRQRRPAAAPARSQTQAADRPRSNWIAGKEPAQLFGELSGRGIAAAGVFFQAFQTNRFQIARHAGTQTAGTGWLGRANLLESLKRRLRLERGPAGEEFVQDRAERVDIGGGPDVANPSGGLFRRHVAGRTQHGPGARQIDIGADRFCEAEVGDLERAVGGHQDVLRLEIAMNDSLAMRRLLQQPAPACGTSSRAGRGLGSTLQAPRQATAFDELEREKRPALLLADVVNLNDVRVLKPSDGLAFRARKRLDLGDSGVPSRQDHLERDEPVQADLSCAVDDTHPSAPELVENLVAGYCGNRTGRGGARAGLGGTRHFTLVGRLEQAAGFERPVDFEQQDQPVGKIREPPRVFVDRGEFTALFAEQHLTVDQFQGMLGLIARTRG